MTAPLRLVVAITGATGSIFGVRLLQVLQGGDVETHLVMTRWGARTLLHETPYSLDDVRGLATRVYAEGDQGAPPSSGSFLTMGMVILPCSMKTLAAIAHGRGDDLVCRAADVVLKERRRLVLAVREAPLNDIHLENMLKLSRMGAVISPPVPSFYNHPKSVDDIVNHTVQRILDLFDVHLDVTERWNGMMGAGGRTRRTLPPAPAPAARSRRPSHDAVGAPRAYRRGRRKS